MISPVLRLLATCSVVVVALTAAGCTRDHKIQVPSMWNESRYKPMEPAGYLPAGTTAQAPVPGTVARGQLREHDELYTGRDANGRLVTRLPFPVTQAVLERGQNRYEVYCTPCHGRDGRGAGMVVKRGFPPPPDYRIARLRGAPVGHYFDVMTHGYGVMYSYASRVGVNDRWAIAAYIRLLQKTQPGVPPDRRASPTLGSEEFPAEQEKSRRSGTSLGH